MSSAELTSIIAETVKANLIKGFKGVLNFSNLNFEGTMGDSQTKFILGSYSIYNSKALVARF